MVEINTVTMLQLGTVLHGTYRIESYLSSGGFGNTYVAKNIEFDETYAIKEFFVKGVCQRKGNSTTISVSNLENADSFVQQKEKFKKEARRLRKLTNPHIVKVYDLFEENGTAYYVMDYVDGENLSTRLNHTHLPLPESEVRNYLSQILDGLEAIHAAGIWHLDIKPANIMVDSHNVVKLIDFGASKQQSIAGGATMSTGISYTNGYAPSEQMAQSYDKFGPWTDFYALGATLYKLLTNQNPPSVTDLSEDESEDKHIALPMPNVSKEMKKLVVWMMQVNRLKRPKNTKEILRLVDCGNFMPPKSGIPTQEDEQTLFKTIDLNEEAITTSIKRKRRRNKTKVFLVSSLCSVMVLSTMCMFYFDAQRNKIIDDIVNNMVKINYQGMSFSINKYEVTQREWEAIMGSPFTCPSLAQTGGAEQYYIKFCRNRTRNKPGKKSNPSYFKGAELPVENVRWDDCQEFIIKLNQKTGHHFRLPTSEEWKCAAKAGVNTKYSGSNEIDDVAWWKGNSGSRTHPVGSKIPNNWGLYDMSGNVCEWTLEHDLLGGWYDSFEDILGINVPFWTNVRPKVCDRFIGFRLAE